MDRKKEKSFIYLVAISIIIFNISSFILSWFYLLENGSLFRLGFLTNQLLIGLYIISYLYFVTIFDGFAFNRRHTTENIYSLSLSSLLSLAIFYFLDTLAFRWICNPLYLLVSFFSSLIFNVLLCDYANRKIFTNYQRLKTVIYYQNDQDLERVKKLNYFDRKYEISKLIINPKNSNLVHDCDVVFISGIDESIRDDIIKKCIEQQKKAYIFPSVGDVVVSGGKYVEDFFLPMLSVSRQNRSAVYLFIKRILDFIISLVALIVFSPFMLITALIIKLYDGGPVFYKQKRLTINAREFTIYKFRSMRVDAEKDGVARLASKNDNRITPVGKIIRAIRFDELPQLVNILKGDMAIIGPRPERPEIANDYLKTYPAFGLRLQAKAGLTGYAQVYGRYNTEPLDKLKMDLFYISNMSFVLDLKIIFLTIKVLFLKESTESIEEGQITAKK